MPVSLQFNRFWTSLTILGALGREDCYRTNCQLYRWRCDQKQIRRIRPSASGWLFGISESCDASRSLFIFVNRKRMQDNHASVDKMAGLSGTEMKAVLRASNSNSRQSHVIIIKPTQTKLNLSVLFRKVFVGSVQLSYYNPNEFGVCVLLGHDIVSLGNWFPTVRK